jgi:hypothetical protein
MGMGASDTLGRLAASLLGLGEVAVQFAASLDVPLGGVLLALPALLANGLLRHTDKYFQLRRGYYRLESIFLLLAFMALARIKNMEGLRYHPPGEWGKLLGLDRIPEVRTLRAKVADLATGAGAGAWGARLSADWMEADPEAAAILYVDGHVRVYHGSQTKLPKHYVARQKLCLRATTDYWVNAMDGQPFFLVTREVDPGLLQVLENEIVPRLEREVPRQPTPLELAADPLLCRFTLIFDREGYSPGFALRMKQRRIACLTYQKFPGSDWREEEFAGHKTTLVAGQEVDLKLAERGVWLGAKVWAREIRKWGENGHQTAVLSTDYRTETGRLAAAMFARWSQENFFKYMREHYGLDNLVDYELEEIPETVRVVNPRYRDLDRRVRGKTALLNRRLAEFGAISLPDDLAPGQVEKYQSEKGKLQEEIAALRAEVEALKSERKGVVRHVPLAELPEPERFKRLSVHSKHFIDTIKMIAYRAETAMVNILREAMVRQDDGRSLLRSIYNSEVDLVPDEKEGTLTIRLHPLANRSENRSAAHLCEELTRTETLFPGTNLRLIYQPVSEYFRRDQEI